MNGRIVEIVDFAFGVEIGKGCDAGGSSVKWELRCVSE
jgi:hypothetical protein